MALGRVRLNTFNASAQSPSQRTRPAHSSESEAEKGSVGQISTPSRCFGRLVYLILTANVRI